MVTGKELEEALPFPYKLEINCDMDDLNFVLGDVVDDIVKKHNEKYETKVDGIVYHTIDFDDVDSDLEWNEYTISIGKEVVCWGSGEEYSGDYSGNIEFYKSLIPIMEKALDEYHDKIIEQQKINEKKLQELEKERHDEILYIHYAIEKDRRAVIYLKRLAKRYPNSCYRFKLRRVYLHGRFGVGKNLKLANKLRGRGIRENF